MASRPLTGDIGQSALPPVYRNVLVKRSGATMPFSASGVAADAAPSDADDDAGETVEATTVSAACASCSMADARRADRLLRLRVGGAKNLGPGAVALANIIGSLAVALSPWLANGSDQAAVIVTSGRVDCAVYDFPGPILDTDLVSKAGEEPGRGRSH